MTSAQINTVEVERRIMSRRYFRRTRKRERTFEKVRLVAFVLGAIGIILLLRFGLIIFWPYIEGFLTRDLFVPKSAIALILWGVITVLLIGLVWGRKRRRK